MPITDLFTLADMLIVGAEMHDSHKSMTSRRNWSCDTGVEVASPDTHTCGIARRDASKI